MLESICPSELHKSLSLKKLAAYGPAVADHSFKNSCKTLKFSAKEQPYNTSLGKGSSNFDPTLKNKRYIIRKIDQFSSMQVSEKTG